MRSSNMYGGGSMFDDFKNVFNRPNNAVVQIIVINVIIFLAVAIFKLFMRFSENLDVYYGVMQYLMMPGEINKFFTRPWTIVTYFFLHEGFFHILFNMLFLYWFGKLIQEFLGSEKVVNLYVLGGLVGGLTYLLIYNILPDSFSQQVETSMMLGASAGVYAIVVGAAAFMPNYTFFLLLLGPVRIKYIAIFYVVVSLVSASDNVNLGGNLAHLGGALIGYLYIKQIQQGNDFGAWISATLDSIKKLFVRDPKIKVSYKREGAKWSGSSSKRSKSSSSGKKGTSRKGDVSQDEIDAILDKISEKGYESLSQEEKQKLFNASKR